MAEAEREMALAALAGLLGPFRRGDIIAREAERKGMEEHAGSLTAQWDERFPDFPNRYFPYTSFRGEHYRRHRDAYLRDIIVRLLADHDSGSVVIVNPACVFGRHACDLAGRLPHARVIGADIDPVWHRIYRIGRGFRFPDNYTFVKDNIFATVLQVQPTAVVFFGACGEVTDGAMDYAVESGARYIMCRTCCHDNIGGNTSVIKRFNSVNRFFRFKNWVYGRLKRHPKYLGYYFAGRYEHGAYPRSEAGRRVSGPEEFREVARHSADSDICRAIIDLDRYLYLLEHRFRVWYQGELFVAEREP